MDFILYLGSQGEGVFRYDSEEELAEDMEVAIVRLLHEVSIVNTLAWWISGFRQGHKLCGEYYWRAMRGPSVDGVVVGGCNV